MSNPEQGTVQYESSDKISMCFLRPPDEASLALTERLEHPIGDAAGKGVKHGVRRVDGDAVLDAGDGDALLGIQEKEY
jgi:hypothetical protein